LKNAFGGQHYDPVALGARAVLIEKRLRRPTEKFDKTPKIRLNGPSSQRQKHQA